MKKYFFHLIIACIAFSSCKKGGDDTSNTLLLAEVYTNGLLDNQYLYSSDKLLLRFNQFSVSGNQSILGLYVLYEYDQDGLIEKRKVFSSDTLNNYYIHSYDNGKRLTRMDWLVSGNALYEYRLYEYDQQNRMIKYSIRNGGTDATKNYTEFVYDAQGLLDVQRSYVWKSNNFLLSQEVDYVPAGKNVYAHWQKFMTFAGDLLVSELTAESRHVRTFNDDGTVVSDYTETGTNRKYNGSGYLVSQTIKKIYVKPALAETVRNMEYTYIQ